MIDLTKYRPALEPAIEDPNATHPRVTGTYEHITDHTIRALAPIIDRIVADALGVES